MIWTWCCRRTACVRRLPFGTSTSLCVNVLLRFSSLSSLCFLAILCVSSNYIHWLHELISRTGAPTTPAVGLDMYANATLFVVVCFLYLFLSRSCSGCNSFDLCCAAGRGLAVCTRCWATAFTAGALWAAVRISHGFVPLHPSSCVRFFLFGLLPSHICTPVSDIDAVSLVTAQQNIDRNQLSAAISLRRASPAHIFEEWCAQTIALRSLCATHRSCLARATRGPIHVRRRRLRNGVSYRLFVSIMLRSSSQPVPYDCVVGSICSFFVSSIALSFLTFVCR